MDLGRFCHAVTVHAARSAIPYGGFMKSNCFRDANTYDNEMRLDLPARLRKPIAPNHRLVTSACWSGDTSACRPHTLRHDHILFVSGEESIHRPGGKPSETLDVFWKSNTENLHMQAARDPKVTPQALGQHEPQLSRGRISLQHPAYAGWTPNDLTLR